MKKIITTLAMATAIAGCSDDATVAKHNISKAADNFEIERRVVFVNGITDRYMLEVIGRCSINDQKNQLEVTCKTGPNSYKTHFLGLSDNVTYFAEQLEPADVSVYHYRVTFKPQTIIPAIDLRTSVDEQG